MPFPIRAVSFDLVGTLLFPAEPVAHTYARMARMHGHEEDEAVLAARLAEAMRAADWDMLVRWGPEGFWRRIVRAAFADRLAPHVLDAVFASLFDWFARPAAWRIHPGLADVLAGLRARGLKLAVCSNWDARAFWLLEDLGLARFFEAVVLPESAGAAKPAPRIYAALAESLGLRPETILHLGDDEETDAVAPRRVGVHGACWRLAPEDARAAAEEALCARIEDAAASWPWLSAEDWARAAAARPDGVDAEEQARRRAFAEKRNAELGITDPAQIADQEFYIRGKMTLEEYAAFLALRHWPDAP